MWQDKIKLTRAIWIVAIGAQRIEFGVLREAVFGNRSKVIWLNETLGESAIESTVQASGQINRQAPVLQDMLAALQRVPLPTHVTDLKEMRVIIADCWLSVTTVPWRKGMENAVSATILARNDLLRAGFELEPDALLRLDDAKFGAPRLAIAYPASLLALLSTCAQRLQITLRHVLPLSFVAWDWVSSNHSSRSQCTVAMLIDQGLILIVRSAGARIAQVGWRAEAWPPSSPSNWQSLWQNIWRRLCIREPVFAATPEVALLDLIRPLSSEPTQQIMPPFVRIPLSPESARALQLAANMRNRATALDAMAVSVKLGAIAQSRWLGMSMAGIIVLSAGLSINQAWRMHTDVQKLKAHLQSLQVQPISAPAPHSPHMQSKQERENILAVNRAIRELNLPFTKLLHALEPPTDILVALLSLEITDTPNTPNTTSTANTQVARLKIIAQAHSAMDMTHYVTLVATRKPFLAAYLTQHEVIPALPEYPYRFTVEILWKN